jgi:serine/threonine protein kinase
LALSAPDCAVPDPEFAQLQDVVRHRYELVGLLGRGGMGAVYRARHLSLDAPVAIKVLPVPASVGADELARFRREAMLAARLPNPHIVPVYEFEIRDDLAYLVMPLIEGVSLAQRIADEGALPLHDVKTLIHQVGGALAFAHERGIIHRDVKPANILWEPANRRWLVTDFGIARHVQRSGDEITSVGAVIGTPAYMSPEQASGGPLDARSDLYAFAATVCEALTGERLKPLADREEAVVSLQAEPARLPFRLAEALAAPLSLSAAQRPPTVRAWLQTVAAAERPGRRRLVAAVLATAAVAVAAGVLAVLGTPTPPAAERPEVIAVLPFTDATASHLGRALPDVFEEELRWVPAVQVVPAAAVAGAVSAVDLSLPGKRDSAIAQVLARFGASGVITGSIQEDDDAGLRLSTQLRRPDGTVRTIPTVRGAPDSLAAMVVTAVLGIFELAEDQAPYRPALPGGGMAARTALRAGDSLFQASDYDAAIERYNRVLELDSTYALAAFKRMLAEVMRAQPTRASRAVRSALEPVRRYRENLDPLNRDLLRVYEVLVVEGDVESAHRLVRDLTDRYPLAIDAWFVKGYLEFYFGPLFGTPPGQARFALEQAVDLNPAFAVIHGLLAFVAFQEGDDDRARAELRAYLTLDSTSSWAEAARLADSIRFRGPGAATRTALRLDERSSSTLELVALAGKSLSIEPAERLFAEDAARALRDRATTADERAVAFRLQLGNAMGAGRAATVDTLLREARRRNVPAPELDRATVLLAATGLGAGSVPDADVTDAAARLAADSNGPDADWLAARWFRGRDDARARQARQGLDRWVEAGGGPALLARSLIADLEALERLTAGDTAGAYGRWAAATRRFHLEEVPFGLVASLWPLRLEWARTAAAAGNPREVVTATGTFEVSPGFMDQVARPVALPLRADALDATGDALGARALRQRYAAVLRDATGPWRAVRDTLLAAGGGP